jgi:hypothetical protein
MNPRSPTVEGFAAIFRRPSLGFAEIAWRWSFGAAAGLLITLSCFEYLDTLPVTRGDLLLLRSRQPVLISKAIGNILRGSGFRLVEAFILLALALVLGWIVLTALGRAATVRGILHHFREREDVTEPSVMLPLAALGFLRTAAALAATIGGFAAFALLGFASTPNETGMAFQVVMIVFVLVWLVWSMINWFLSLAAIFVVAGGRDTFAAITDAVDLLLRRSGAVFAVSASFGLAHAAAFVVASSAAVVSLVFGAALPGRVGLAGLAGITLLYFAAADFLYIGRLAAYVAILELPEVSSQPSAVSFQPSGSIDPYELILSDLPRPVET